MAKMRLPDRRLEALCGVLERGPVLRSKLGEFVEYLDYVDHAVYSTDEIAGFFEQCVALGRAVRTPDGWKAAGPERS